MTKFYFKTIKTDDVTSGTKDMNQHRPIRGKWVKLINRDDRGGFLVTSYKFLKLTFIHKCVQSHG